MDKLVSGENEDEDAHFCVRGLETRAEKRLQQKQLSRMMSRTVVMKEQERQRIARRHSDTSIALMYRRHTERSQIEAQMLANQDQKLVASELSATLLILARRRQAKRR